MFFGSIVQKIGYALERSYLDKTLENGRSWGKSFTSKNSGRQNSISAQPRLKI
jgi:hypothetical protein